MATSRKRRNKNQGKALPVERVALVLSVAAREGVPEASTRFGVAQRTIRRYREKVLAGNWPEVADLVSVLTKSAIERCKDLLTDVYETSLRKIRERMDDAKSPPSYAELLSTAEKMGELKIQGVPSGDSGSGTRKDSGNEAPPRSSGGETAGARSSPGLRVLSG